MAPSLQLVHSTSGRWRYRLRCDQTIDWETFSRDLNQVFPPGSWILRLNKSAGSLVVLFVGDLQAQPSVDLSQLVRSRVRQQLLRQDILVPEIPLSTTVVVHPTIGERFRWLTNPAHWIANGLSLSLSLSALLTSLALFALGLLGLFLPLSPGLVLLMLASLVFDLALSLRRPFVEVA